MKRAKWILVDWIGTSTNIRGTVVPELERFGKRCRVNADWDEVMDAWGVAQRVHLDQVVAGQQPWRPQVVILLEAFQDVLRRIGVDMNSIPKAAVDELGRFYSNLKLWPDVNDGIAMLRRILPTALYSLSPREILEMQTAEAEIQFDRQISAESYRSYPPSPGGFLGAAEELGVLPREIVFLSSHPPMLRGAEEAGMQLIQIERPMRDTRLVIFEPTRNLNVIHRFRDFPKTAEWLATNLPR